MNIINVFIVEDDPMVKEINKRFLEKMGSFKVIDDASSIKEAKIKLKSCKADLVLLDVFLPDGKGIELLKWIRSEEMNLDTILITADKCRESVDDAFKYGAVDYLIKPFKFERFKESLINYKNRFLGLNNAEDINQEHIDQYILNIKTYNKIIEFMKLKRNEELTAEEIAKGSGLARVTARRYLEKMVEESKVEIYQEYGKIGRPTNYYKVKK